MWLNIQNAILEITGTSTGAMTFWERILYLIAKYGPSYMEGAWNTLYIALISTIAGCIIGFAVGIVQTIPLSSRDSLLKRVVVRFCHILLNIYVEVFRGTPMMIQAVFIYYGAAQLFGIYMEMMPAALFIVSINTGAYMAESVRGGIISVDPGQTEGAKAIGMNHFQTMLYVILPQALRNILPQIGNNFIINIKDTSVMFIIGFTEFFAAHKAVVGASYRYFPSAAIEMIGYLTMTLLASFILRYIEKKMDGSSSYDLAQADALTMAGGTYNHPNRGTPFDERNPEGVKSMLREELRRQTEREEAKRKGREVEAHQTRHSATSDRKGE